MFGGGVRAPLGSVFHGGRVAVSAARVAPRISMAEQSPSVPFLPKPKNLSPDMIGYTGFDPFSISDVLDIKWLQESEIKHGRICMLAFLGIIVQEFVHLPGKEFSNPLATDAFFQVPVGGIAQIFLFCGMCEFLLHRGKITYGDMFSDPNQKPGHLGFNPLNLPNNATSQLQEIKNGRLAMCGVGGVIHSMFVFKTPIVAQLLNFTPMSIPGN